MKKGLPLKSVPGCPALNLMEETLKMKYEGEDRFLKIFNVRYNAKKGRTLLAKVRDIISSRKDSRTGCKFYAILAHYTD